MYMGGGGGGGGGGGERGGGRLLKVTGYRNGYGEQAYFNTE